jgi:hypothetical protein
MTGIARIIALGASNLTRGFQSLVSVARAEWGSEIQVLAALGHGRSSGAPSRVGIRTLPGILESGLWRMLDSLPEIPTRALVTDVGNDILYGYSAEQILAWIGEVLSRLQCVTKDITLTNLPLANIQGLTQAKYLLLRSILFPSCRLSLIQVLDTAGQVNAGLSRLSVARRVRLCKLDPAWYGTDPIHIRRSFWQSAWREMLDVALASKDSGRSVLEGLKLYFMAPERRRILGFEQYTPQLGVQLPSGGRVWLY